VSGLRALVEAELTQAVDPRITAMAATLAQRHPGTLAVLFYGSCLRQSQLDGLMLDFYVIVDDYRAAYDRRWLATANRLVPPNVFPFSQADLASKYAVLSANDFRALNLPEASNVSVWARFAQPTRLIWSRDDAARDTVIDAVATAAPTLFYYARPLAESNNALTVWRAGFAQTYRAEIRAERNDRSGSIVDAEPERYIKFGAAIDEEKRPLTREQAKKRWRAMQRRGKLLTMIRLAKASFTFAGGIDYLAWKINRHAGTKIAIQPWQRRWPLIAAIGLVPRLIWRGAIK
jgi:hypothetical protein